MPASEVKQGQLLAELDPGDARLQASAAQADMARLGGDLRALPQAGWRRSWSASRPSMRSRRPIAPPARKYELMRNQDDYTRLRAPRDGVIASRQAEAGQVVAAGQPIFLLAADGGREVAIGLPEARIRDFRTGQPAVVELWSAPGQALAGHIREIAAAADPQTRTYAARVALDGAVAADAGLGQSARVFITGADRRRRCACRWRRCSAATTAPAAVWVVTGRQGPTSAPVRLGGYGEDSVPVLAGVGVRRLGGGRRRPPAARGRGGDAGRPRATGRSLAREALSRWAASTCRNGRCATARWCCS